MKNLRSLFLLFIASAIMLSCEQGISQNRVSPKEFAQKIESVQNAQLIDVRTPGEYANGHMVNAVNIDWNGPDFGKAAEALDKSKPVFVYCLSGKRSAAAAEEMRSNGFKEVIELDGGIMKWRAEGLPESNKATSAGMSDEDLKKILSTDKLVLVDFFAPWCKPCKEMAPYMEEIAKANNDKLVMTRINADDNQYMAKKLNVDALPTLFLYKNNAIIWQHTGFISKEDLLKALKL